MGIEIDVGIKNSRVRAGLAQIRSQVSQFSGNLKGMMLSAFSVAGVVVFAEKMREVRNQALRMGTSAESVQRISKAAKAADVDFEGLAKAINKVTLEAGKAASGDKAAGNLFKKLHIDATAFMQLNPEQKLLALSAAFQQSRSSGSETTSMLELLGNKGVQIIPLLARGPKALEDGMKSASVQTNSTVEAFANLSKNIDKVKNIGVIALNTVISKLEQTGKVIGAVSGVASGLMSGLSWDDAISAAADGLNNYEADQQKDDKKEAAAVDDFDPDAANEDKREALRKSIAEAEGRNRADALKGEAKINELLAQRQELEDQITDDTVEGLEAKKRALDLDREITAAKREQKGAMEKAEKGEAAELEKQYLAKASPEERKRYLEDKQKRLLKESTELEESGDAVKGLEKRTEADALQPEIDEAGKQKTDKRLAVPVDSLQRAGGGGGVGPMMDAAQRSREQQVRLLQQIKDTLAQRGDVVVGKALADPD